MKYSCTFSLLRFCNLVFFFIFSLLYPSISPTCLPDYPVSVTSETVAALLAYYVPFPTFQVPSKKYLFTPAFEISLLLLTSLFSPWYIFFWLISKSHFFLLCRILLSGFLISAFFARSLGFSCSITKVFSLLLILLFVSISLSLLSLFFSFQNDYVCSKRFYVIFFISFWPRFSILSFSQLLES